jgi:YesN/AraC family two-component response regulator
MLSRFAFAFIPLNFAVLPEYPEISPGERRKILDWEMEIAERLCSSFFPRTLLLPHSGGDSGVDDSLLLFVWESDSSKNNPQALNQKIWESGAAQFRERLSKMSVQITRLGVEVLASKLYKTPDPAESPARALAALKQQYYLGGRETHSEIVKKARQYILDNVKKRIMLQEVAEYVCISPGYLSTLFRREYKQNLVDFINQTKVDLACELLREDKYRINEISYKLGFENAFYFTRVFHRRTGMTPSEYQNRARQA